MVARHDDDRRHAGITYQPCQRPVVTAFVDGARVGIVEDVAGDQHRIDPFVSAMSNHLVERVVFLAASSLAVKPRAEVPVGCMQELHRRPRRQSQGVTALSKAP